MAYIPPAEEIDMWNISESADLNLNLFDTPVCEGGGSMLATEAWCFDSGLPDGAPVDSADPAWNQLEDAWKYCHYDPSLWQPISPPSSQASPSVTSLAAPAMGLDTLSSYLGPWPSMDEFSVPQPTASPTAATYSPAQTSSPAGFEMSTLQTTRLILPKSASPPDSPMSDSQSSAISLALSVSEMQPQLTCPYPDCSRGFATPGQLKAHEKRHTKPYACKASGCGKRYGAKEDLNRHLCQEHGDMAASLGIRKKERTCNYCSYRSRIDNVKRHERTCSRRPK